MAQKFVNKAAGLHTFKNELVLPDGAMKIADNVIIDRDGIVESRRGFALYSEFGELSNRAKQLLQYKDRLLVHYDDKLLYEGINGTLNQFDGSYTHVNSNRMRYLENKGNLYFTTDKGIKKISAKNSSNFTTNPGFIYDSGAVRALDFTANCNYESSGFFNPNSIVAYRVLWGYNDVNNNLILGYPSEIVIVQNIDLLTSCFIDLKISIPSEISLLNNQQNYFYQIYRSNQKTIYNSNGDSQAADVEFKLVIEEFPTSTELTQGFIETSDITPDDFRNNGTNLYTNEVTGEGEAQANAQPPLAADITYFKGSVFYANTKTRHNKSLSLLSVDNMTSGTTKFFIANEDQVDQYTFRGVEQVSKIDFSGYTPTDISTELNQKYFLINAANNIRKYFVWFDGIGSNEIQELKFVGVPDSGTFKLGLYGSYTDDIAANATEVEIKTALESLPDVDLVFVTDTSTSGNKTFKIEFGGSLAMQDIDKLTVQKTDLLDSSSNVVLATVTELQQGSNNSPSGSDTIGRIGIRVDLVDMVDVTSITELLDRITLTFLQDQFSIDFTTSIGSDYIEFLNNESGPSDDISNSLIAGLPIANNKFTTPTVGLGESLVSPFDTVLLSTDPSNGIRLEQTSKSLLRMTNYNTTGIVNGFYLSSVNDIPGYFSLQSKSIEDKPFYLATNDPNVSTDFSPTLPIVQEALVASLDVNYLTNNKVNITWNNHGLVTGNGIVLCNPVGLTSGDINGIYVVSVVDSDNFSVTIPSLVGILTQIDAFKPTLESDNEEKANRIYYSKNDIPEAVPLFNYFDVGGQDYAIKRIIPLRDSLFILKEEGIYRLSGTDANNFVVTLFDESSPIIAPDSPAVLNNQIFMLSTQGIITVSDTGVDIMSRNIEKDILYPTSNNFPNFKTQIFGISSESDRAYHLFMPTETTDEHPTQCYRFNVFTRAWTRWDVSKTCGIVKKADDKIYFGAADINYIEQERKNFLRSDYADRQYDNEIIEILNGKISLSTFQNINQYYAIYQEQYISISRFNNLLSRLDSDPFLTDIDYLSTLQAGVGSDLGTLLSNLIVKISIDDPGGTYTAYSSSNIKEDLRDGFNLLVTQLNNSDGVFYSNYRSYTDILSFEDIINTLNTYNQQLTVLVETPFILGDCIIFEAIKSRIEYSPETLGDASLGKQFREATLMFDELSFTFGVMGFRSDVYASIDEIVFPGDGNGDYGNQVYGEQIYGGLSNERPFRTYVPRNHQRARMIYINFIHPVARENFLLNGYSVTYNESTTPRFYRR